MESSSQNLLVRRNPLCFELDTTLEEYLSLFIHTQITSLMGDQETYSDRVYSFREYLIIVTFDNCNNLMDHPLPILLFPRCTKGT